MTEYYVVEKDVEETIGFIHHGSYRSRAKAEKRAKQVRHSLGREYYDVFVAVME